MPDFFRWVLGPLHSGLQQFKKSKISSATLCVNLEEGVSLQPVYFQKKISKPNK